MLKTKGLLMVAAIAGALFAAGCSDSDESMPADNGGSGGTAGTGGAAGMGGVGGVGGTAGEGGTGGTAGTGGTGGSGATGGTGGSAGTGGSSGGPQSFLIRIENRSDQSELATPIAPGLFVVHDLDNPLFTAGQADRGEGLEALAEDANPAMLAASVDGASGVDSVGVFATPVGGASPGPAVPGAAFEFTVQASPGQRLSFANMFGQSNDLFFGPDGTGIPLFDQDELPISQDVTALVHLWDAGTERNEPPGLGPNQAPRQSAPNTGPAEGRISLRVDGTRALPLATSLVDITVSESNGTYSLELKNTSDMSPFATPIAPVIHTLHDGSFQLFEPGMSASAGLEHLAEDGDPSALAAQIASTAADVGIAGTGPTLPGDSVSFQVTPTESAPRLSIAAMVGQSNDAFIATLPAGTMLLNTDGTPRAAADVKADLMRMLRVWDAGTEANEVPGIGPNQAPRQAMPNTGPVDPDNHVRVYSDSTNDLSALLSQGKIKLTITHATGTMFDVSYENLLAGTTFPALLAPVAWAVHDGSMSVFDDGGKATAGLEKLAEDGNPSAFAAELMGMSTVSSSGAVGTGPISSGSFDFQVTVDSNHRYFDIVNMLAPSNDTFLSLGPMGIALLDTMGSVRSDADIAADVATNLAARDAGTEANEAAAGGPHMAPYQSSPNMGASEGDGTVRMVNDIWSYPPIDQLVRVTVTAQ